MEIEDMFLTGPIKKGPGPKDGRVFVGLYHKCRYPVLLSWWPSSEAYMTKDEFGCGNVERDEPDAYAELNWEMLHKWRREQG